MPLDASSITAAPSPQTAPNAVASRDFPPTPFEVVLRYLETVKKDKVTFKEIEDNCGDYAAEVMAYVASMLGAMPLPGVVNAAGAALWRYVDRIPANNGGMPMPKKKRGKFKASFFQKRIEDLQNIFLLHENSVKDLKEVLVTADLFYRTVTTWEPAEKAKLKQEHWQKDDWRWKVGLFMLKIDAFMLITPGFVLNNTFQSGAAMIKLAALNKRSTLGLAVGVLGTLAIIGMQAAFASVIFALGANAVSQVSGLIPGAVDAIHNFSVESVSDWAQEHGPMAAGVGFAGLALTQKGFRRGIAQVGGVMKRVLGKVTRPARQYIGQKARKRLEKLGYTVPTYNL